MMPPPPARLVAIPDDELAFWASRLDPKSRQFFRDDTVVRLRPGEASRQLVATILDAIVGGADSRDVREAHAFLAQR